MTCPKCGAQLLEGATFCGACGTRLGSGGGGIQIDEDSRGRGRGYDYEVLHQPSFSLAVVRLQAEQSIQAESGAMVSMSANIELQSTQSRLIPPGSIAPLADEQRRARMRVD